MVGEFILILGEDAEYLKERVEALEDMGFQAFAVATVEAAREVLGTLKAHVIVVDGAASFAWEGAITVLLARRLTNKSIPVVALVDDPGSTAGRDAQAAGCAAVLARSMSPRSLAAAVRLLTEREPCNGGMPSL